MKVVDEDDDEAESSWEGKINANKKEMKKLQQQIFEFFDQQQRENNSRQQKMEAQLTEVLAKLSQMRK